MAKASYSRNDLGVEVQAPWGYYQPFEEVAMEYGGRQLLYTLGSACVEASCCGHGSWSYARVEGYPSDDLVAPDPVDDAVHAAVEIDTIEDASERAAIAQALMQKHPGVRVEFR